MTGGCAFQQFNYALGLRAANYGHREFDHTMLVRKRPVTHLTRDERPVRHNDLRPVGGTNNAGPDPNAVNLSKNAAYLDDVTNLDRTFKKQNQAGHKIIDHVL